MKLYTSNYARNGNNRNAVAISIKPPKWYKGKQYLSLAPSWDIVMGVKAGEITEDEYTYRYLELLNTRELDPFKVANELGDGAVMLCYESPKDFCHRHIVATWIQESTCIEVVELGVLPAVNKDVEGLFEF